jgi:hypothetical protein
MDMLPWWRMWQLCKFIIGRFCLPIVVGDSSSIIFSLQVFSFYRFLYLCVLAFQTFCHFIRFIILYILSCCTFCHFRPFVFLYIFPFDTFFHITPFVVMRSVMYVLSFYTYFRYWFCHIIRFVYIFYIYTFCRYTFWRCSLVWIVE